MTSIADASELINRLTGGNDGNPENVFWAKTFATGTFLGGVIYSSWLWEGYPGAGVAPGAVAVPTRATAGAFRHLNSTAGRQRWLRSMAASSWTGARFILYDRLLHQGGLSGGVTTAQAVGTSITRYTGAESIGNLILAEIYGQVGATAVSLSCNYLDSAGTTRLSGSTMFGGATYRSPCVLTIPYNVTTGANSVTQVVDATLSVSTGGAGNWGITIARPLAEIQVGTLDTSGFGSGSRMLIAEDVEIKADACLGILYISPGTSTPIVRGSYTTVER